MHHIYKLSCKYLAECQVQIEIIRNIDIFVVMLQHNGKKYELLISLKPVLFFFQLYLQPGFGVAILIIGFIFGFSGVGAYPLSLELGVEATYPVEESISSAFLYLSGQVQAAILIVLVDLLAVNGDHYAGIEVCSSSGGSDESGLEAKDYRCKP